MWNTDVSYPPSATLWALATTSPGYIFGGTRFRGVGNDLPYKWLRRIGVSHVAAEHQRRSDVVKFHLMLDIVIVWHQLIWRWYRWMGTQISQIFAEGAVV